MFLLHEISSGSSRALRMLPSTPSEELRPNRVLRPNECRVPLRLLRVHVALNHEQSTAVFRIAQEAQRNAAFFLAEQEKSWKQLLELLGMQERAHLVGGTIEISGVAGMGTTITARVTTTKNSGGD